MVKCPLPTRSFGVLLEVLSGHDEDHQGSLFQVSSDHTHSPAQEVKTYYLEAKRRLKSSHSASPPLEL